MSFFSKIREGVGYIREKVDQTCRKHGYAVAAAGAAVSTAALVYGGLSSPGTATSIIYALAGGLGINASALSLGTKLKQDDIEKKLAEPGFEYPVSDERTETVKTLGGVNERVQQEVQAGTLKPESRRMEKLADNLYNGLEGMFKSWKGRFYGRGEVESQIKYTLRDVEKPKMGGFFGKYFKREPQERQVQVPISVITAAPKAVEPMVAAVKSEAIPQLTREQQDQLYTLKNTLYLLYKDAYESDLTTPGEFLEKNQGRGWRNPNSVDADKLKLIEKNKERKVKIEETKVVIEKYQRELPGQPQTNFDEIEAKALKDAKEKVRMNPGWI